MSKLTSLFALTALGSFAIAPAAFAGDKMDMKMETTAVEAAATMDAPEARTITLRTDTEAEVLGAVDSSELIPVEGPDGQIYYNRFIPVSELPDPALELRVLDTVQINHEGEVFTNKIVQELN